MSALREAIKDLPFDETLRGVRCEETRMDLARMADETLDGVERMLGEWAYTARNDGRYALHHAFFLAPQDLPGPVVLDATATQNYLWTLLEDRAVLVPTPEGVRRYDNVRLRVARVQGLGKHKMKELGKDRIPKVMHDVALRVEQDDTLDDKRVLMVLHKDVLCHAATDDPRFQSFSTANWGGIDGKNDWNDFSTAVLFGLHNLPDVWSHNMFAALQGLPSREWFETGAWQGLQNVRTEMHRRQLTATIVQAINRVRCRRTVDILGNCKPTVIYLALKPGEEGDVVLKYLQQEMPGIVIEDWALELEGPRQQLNHRSRHPAILAYMEARRPGRVSFNTLISDLGLPPSFKRELQKTLRDPNHPLTKALQGAGVFYVSDGRGRGKGSYLLKTPLRPN